MGRVFRTLFEVCFRDLGHYEEVYPYFFMLLEFLGVDWDDVEVFVTRDGGLVMRFALDDEKKWFFIDIGENVPGLVFKPLFDVDFVRKKIFSMLSVLYEVLRELEKVDVDGKLIIDKLRLVFRFLEECEKEVYKYFDCP